MLKRAPLCMILICLLTLHATSLARAQSHAALSFETNTTALQTGQTYDMAIRLDGASDVWVVNVEVAYDPQRLYVIGTQSGSPVSQGPLFAPPESTVVVRNAVEQAGNLVYTLSMLAPADPINTDGVIGTFRVYPLSAGETSLTIRSAEVTGVTFTGSGANRTPSAPQEIPFTAVLTNLTITGDTVQPPPEATATPAATPTSDRAAPAAPTSQFQTPLPNVTAVPDSGEAAPGDGAAGLPLPIIIILVVMALAGTGAAVLFVLSQRRP